MKNFYFREKEILKINDFFNAENKKAMAIYGRRRIGKTELVLHVLKDSNLDSFYYQVSSPDYGTALSDFINIVGKDDELLSSLSTFKDVFIYLSKT